ncbi:MAG: PD40 domain-containing protein [Gemmatimonadaceae bacterium]|nr:PD40 domain-containing protein [Gemmatimonadaceae bacterium]
MTSRTSPVSRLAVCCLLALVVGDSTPAHAQVDPRGAMRTLATTHLRVHARADQEPLARRAAAIAEVAYAQLARELTAPAGPIDLLIADNVDFSNGFAQVFPTNRVVIYAVPPIGSTELRFHDDWLRLVITHELAHIFHIDRARGLWRAGRWVFGRNPIFFPNSLTPSWVKEGLAVHYETALAGSGRLVSTESRTVARAAAREQALPPIRRWSLATSRFPQGQTAYAYGALLMEHASRVGGDTSMRRFVETTAYTPIPFFLDRASRIGFGVSFSRQFDAMRDSLRVLVATLDSAGDAPWRALTHDGWYAESPRWQSPDTVVWTASNGRDVTGLFVADVRAPGKVSRVARRNGLDVNAPTGRGDSTVFAQIDYRNPYELRSDLYRGTGSHERRLTNGARLVQPDVRRDGAIVAIQLAAAATHLVRVDSAGRVRTLRTEHTWADPRWSPDGSRMVAVQFLPTGEERIVVMDSLGHTQQIVTGARAVFASPSFTPDARRLVWSSDRSGRMQLETAPVAAATAPLDTLRWREEREEVRVASAVTTGVYQPSVSPDGRLVAALRYRENGFVVSVAPLDTMGAMARNLWYPRTNVVRGASDTVLPTVGAFGRYQAVRQLWPRYWLPSAGTGRQGQATYGVSTSGSDILERHDWVANVLVDPDRGETDAAAAYRYRGIGVPVLDVSWSQAWDATFRVTDTAGTTLGFLARRRRFHTLASVWSVPRIRTGVNGTLGVQYEVRDFSSDIDALLGPPTGLLRRGTRYPSAFASASISTARRGACGISVEEGVVASVSTNYRWRDDAPSTTGSWRHNGTLRGYLPLNLPGFSRHVLMGRVAASTIGDNSSTELSVGGVSGVSTELLPGLVVGDPGRTFPVRGVAPGAQYGARALGGSVEYRAPLILLRDAPGPFTLFADKLSVTLFSDAARAWCPAALARRQTGLCERPGERDGWIASAGAELVLDLAVQYDSPYRLRIGAAAPYAAPRGISRHGAFYVTLGSVF